MRRPIPVVFAIACGGAPAPAPAPAPVPAAVAPAPDTLPASLVEHMQSYGWGQMHLQWHTERRWDRLPPAAVAYAERQGWQRAAKQEGEPGNGVEFLAMHRAMLQLLVEKDPSAKQLLAGWQTPPLDPSDPADPLPGGATTPFDPDMRAALERLQQLRTFASEDDFGLYLETSFRPTATDRKARATDRTAGIHNYLHARFQDPASPIDLGNPALNLKNPRFWRLHGWIDRLWTAYRAQAGLRDDDPAYQALMRDARAHMTMRVKASREPPPRELIDAVRP